MNHRIIRMSTVAFAMCGIAVGFALGQAAKQNPPKAVEDSETTIKEADVPKPVLEALKKLANGAPFTEFAREVEYGHVFYEGSWKGANGNVDAVVTESGDLVVIEEIVPVDKVPSAARSAAQSQAGKDAKLTFEKKTGVLYEVHFKKGDKSQELIFTPDGRPYNEDAAEGAQAGEKNEADENAQHDRD